MTDLRDQQLQYEIESDTQAAAERLEQLRTQSADGDINLPRAQRFIARAYAQVKQSLDDTVAVKTRGVGGKFKGWLRAIPTDVAAVIALRECISQCAHSTSRNRPATIQVLAGSIGRLYELEVRIREAETINPMYMQKIHEQVKENASTDKRHLRNLYNVAYDRVVKGQIDSTLTEAEVLQLGKFGVQAVMDAGLLHLVKARAANGHNMYSYELTQEVLEFLCDYTETDVQSILNKSTGAMMCPPDPWTTLNDGGYLSARRKQAQPAMTLRGIRKSERKRLRAAFTEREMPVVFDALNFMQSVPFSLHAPTLAAIVRVWQSGGAVMGVPSKSGPQKPPSPFAETWVRADAPEAEVAEFVRWKRSARSYYTEIKEWRGKVREVCGFIKVSTKQPHNIWFPMFFDKRGRWYYRGSPNPQGSDLSKAALHFGRKKPLGKRGLFWLKVHIANCYGFDKVRFIERAKWTDTNWETIQRALDEPENHSDVWGNDTPWCMFSAAWELREAIRSGNPEAYSTGIPVHMDATCSGLQHFSAILRDPVGGGYTNLYDSSPDFTGPKQDIYSKVGTNAVQAIQRDTEDSDAGKAKLALWWDHVGIPRNMAKTPVMTYVYGATLQGTVAFVQDYVEQDLGLQFPEGERPYDYAAYAAKKLIEGIAATVPAADACMRWLRSIAKQQPKGQRMEWRSPTGFLVQHDYQDYDEIVVALRSCGVTEAVVREFNEDTKPIPMQNAVSPNFVHALDASHLTLTALSMQASECDIVGIHDSYGTHCCDVDTMHSAIRESFVEMYRADNVLANFLWDVNGVGEVPMRGTLNLTDVLKSEFFFC
jgi:DNA-directed RNA polymerase